MSRSRYHCATPQTTPGSVPSTGGINPSSLALKGQNTTSPFVVLSLVCYLEQVLGETLEVRVVERNRFGAVRLRVRPVSVVRERRNTTT